VTHYGIVSGVIECQQPALAIPFARLGRGTLDGVGRETGKLGLARDVQAPGVRGVLHIVFEGRLRRGQLLHDLLETRLGGGWQVDTRQVEVSQRMADDAFLSGRRIVGERPFHGGVGALQIGIL